MGQQTGSGKTAFNRPRWSRGFDNSVAARAGELRPHVANDLEAVGDVLELFRHIVAKVPQLTAAIRAAITSGNVRHHFAIEMPGQRLALRSCLRFPGRRNTITHGFHLGLGRLFLFKLELELLELEDDLLALGSEDRVPQLLDHELHVLDALAARTQLIDLFRECLAVRLQFRFEPAEFLITISDQ
jgi:hypothetical protein